jgi:hypothetical protein
MDSFTRCRPLLSLLALVALPVCGQVDNGNITGRVTDPTGAVIAGARVTVTQTDMNFETQTETNEEGLYRAVQLRPGPYRITVVAQGFKRHVRENVVLRVNETLAIDARMEVGALAESIEVRASASLLETETSASGTVVKGDYFYSLPIYQRNIKNILYYTPGLTYSGVNWAGSMGSMHINGLRSGYIGFTEDGAVGTTGDGITTDTILNTIADVKVLTTTLPAEYGHAAGGLISVVKKSGTNELHGIASMYGRTRRMQHRKYFDLYRNSQATPPYDKPPGLLFYQPDANLNGPVYIPKLYDGRNKTFFMIAYQWLIEKQSKQQVSTVPTPEMLNGDFTFGGIGQPIYDPRTTRQDADGSWYRDPFPGNIVPRAAWSKVAQKVLGMNPYLPPNRPGSVTTTGVANNIMTGPTKLVRWDSMSGRLDQQFNLNLKAFLTWTGNSRWERQPPWTVANPFFDFSRNIAHTWINTWGAGATWVISPTLVSDFRASYYRYNQQTDSIAYMQDYAGQLGIAGLPKDAMPGIWPGGFTESLNVGNPSWNLQEVVALHDDVSKVQGTHSFKWGYELMRYRQNSHGLGSPDGSFSYTGAGGLRTNGTGLPNTGNTLAAFLTGAISSVSFSRTLNASLPRVWQHSFYFQDDWKATRTLTLNLGLRYSVETPPVQKYGLISIWDPNAVDDSLYTNYTCPAGGCKGAWTHPKGARPYDWDLNRWDPRVGLAWHPSRRFVVRGGFALTHIDMRAGFLYTDELMSDSTNIQQATGVPKPLFYLDQGVPSFTYPEHRADGSVPYRGNPTSHSATIVSRNMQAAYTMSWNFGIQTELSRDYMLETQYKGSAQVRNSGSYDLNSRPWGIIPNPTGSGWMDLNDPANAAYRNSWLNNPSVSRPWTNWGNVNLQGNNGHLTHHEGTVKIEKRYSRGLNFLAFYTWSKTIDGNSLSNPYLNWHLNKGRADWNQTHVFTGTMNYEIPVGQGRRFLNHGGWRNALLGGFDFVWTYNIATGSPLGMSITGQNTQNYPSWMGTYGDVILSKVPRLRDNWQDLGADRFTQNNQNSMIACGTAVVGVGNDCFTYIPSFSRGTNGRNLWDRQRIIVANMSASKEIPIRERLRFQFRFDFQNPFKWYNWGSPTTQLSMANLNNTKSYGTTGVGSEATAAATGGVPLMDLTLAFKW